VSYPLGKKRNYEDGVEGKRDTGVLTNGRTIKLSGLEEELIDLPRVLICNQVGARVLRSSARSCE